MSNETVASAKTANKATASGDSGYGFPLKTVLQTHRVKNDTLGAKGD